VHAGAEAINQQPLTRIEVHGKNLFYFFGEGEATVVLHFHFGMSGAFKTVTRGDTLPEPKETTRLVLIGDKIVGQLSAMIVQHGGLGALAVLQQVTCRIQNDGASRSHVPGADWVLDVGQLSTRILQHGGLGLHAFTDWW